MAEGNKLITLDAPVKRGDQEIVEISVRKPVAGELRGISLLDLAQLDVTALQKVLPRVTTPPLSPIEINNLEPADLMQLGVAVASFLVTKSMREDQSPSA